MNNAPKIGHRKATIRHAARRPRHAAGRDCAPRDRRRASLHRRARSRGEARSQTAGVVESHLANQRRAEKAADGGGGRKTSVAGRFHLDPGKYSDGLPLHEVQYLECKLILRPNHFTSRESLFDFIKVLRRPAAKSGVEFSGKDYAASPLQIREVVFLDTADSRLYESAFIMRRRKRLTLAVMLAPHVLRSRWCTHELAPLTVRMSRAAMSSLLTIPQPPARGLWTLPSVSPRRFRG